MQKLWGIVLVILSGLAVAAGLSMDRFGVDVEPDSAVYMSAGILCAHGEGVSEPNLIGAPRPMTWFPPAVPWMVSICERSGLDIRKAFAVFNAVSWGVLTGWIGWLAFRTTGGSPLLGILAAATILTSEAICYDHSMLYSEPPFLLWTTGSLAALAFWWKHPRLRWAAAAALCVGASLLTRYAGMTLVLTGGLAMFARPGLEWRRRLAMLAIFGALSSGPLFAWHLWQKNVRHADLERTLEWHPVTPGQIGEGVDTLASFIVPGEFADFPHSDATILAVVSALIVAAVWSRQRCPDGMVAREKPPAVRLENAALPVRLAGGGTVREKPSASGSPGGLRSRWPALVWICAVFMGVYPAFLLVSISIADADTPLDARILSILIPPGVIIASHLAFVTGWERMGGLAKCGAFIVIGGLLALHGISTLRYYVIKHDVTLSPNHPSALLHALRAIPDNAILFSNEPASIYMAARLKSEGLPRLLVGNESETAKRNRLNRRIEFMKKAMAARGGWVVYWIQLHGDPVISEDIVKKNLPILEITHFDDGALLRVAPR